ncbi:hypothetical protein [Syntrophomonas curvata]
MREVLEVRWQALKEGRDSFEAVWDWLNGLSNGELDSLLAEFESRKTWRQRMKTRDAGVYYCPDMPGRCFFGLV